ncbi:MAG: hypothetical protein PVI57_18055 [Gemmatimonadota bacterium]
MADGRVDPSNPADPYGEACLQEVQAGPRRTDLHEPFVEFVGGTAPERPERDMGTGELDGRHAEEEPGDSRKKLGSYGGSGCGDVLEIGLDPGASHDGEPQSVTESVGLVPEEAERHSRQPQRDVHLA